LAELIAVTTTDGRTEIINLDYVVKIEAAHQNKSSITIVANLVPMLAMLMLVKGTPSEIASAHRIQGKQAPQYARARGGLARTPAARQLPLCILAATQVLVSSRQWKMGEWHSEVAYAAFPPPPLDVL
jgi:hypothetical protein